MPWAKTLSDFFGGVHSAGLIHRYAAVIMFGYFIYHLYSLYKKKKARKESWIKFIFKHNSLMFNLQDIKDFYATIKWFFGLDKPVQLTDSWHFFKMWMIIFICTSISLMVINSPLMVVLVDNWFDYVINFCGQITIMGIVWNKTFSLFYDKIWIKKNLL